VQQFKNVLGIRENQQQQQQQKSCKLKNKTKKKLKMRALALCDFADDYSQSLFGCSTLL